MESLGENWRKWVPETSIQSNERSLKTYEGYLGFKRDDLKGKTVLDLGSGKTELFSRSVRDNGINTNVISLNPDYSLEKSRQSIKEKADWGKKSVAAIGQELPFRDEFFDKILAVYSVASFSNPHKEIGNPEAAEKWVSEIVRVLKPGGEARLAPINSFNKKNIEEREWKKLLEGLKSQGLNIEIERIKKEEVDEREARKFFDDDDFMPSWRLIIKKPDLKLDKI